MVGLLGAYLLWHRDAQKPSSGVISTPITNSPPVERQSLATTQRMDLGSRAANPAAAPSSAPPAATQATPSTSPSSPNPPSNRAKAADTRDLHERVAAAYESIFDGKHRVLQLPYVAAHELVMKEDIDPNWSVATNRLLDQSIRSAFGDRFDISLIDCRTDICEIRANSREGADYEADLADFQAHLSSMQQQEWYARSNLDESTFMVSPLDDGLLVMMAFLTRK